MKTFTTLIAAGIFCLFSTLVAAHSSSSHSESAYVIVDVLKADSAPRFGDCSQGNCTVLTANTNWEIAIDDINNVRLGTASLQKIDNSGLFQAKIYLPDDYLPNVGQTVMFQHVLVIHPFKGYVHFSPCTDDRLCLKIHKDTSRPHL